LIGDYAQNLELPHFGAEQPQDIYYFSAITVNVFGIADVTRSPTHMIAYGYTEDQGSKGGNNVASLLVKGLHDLGWIQQEGTTGKQLSIILDNCGGQNKNNIVLRLALWLVECKYFKKVEIIFYVRGHTKNACDRLFNQLKKHYHKQQIFTMGQMVTALDSSRYVSFNLANSHCFLDYAEMLDFFYNKFPAGMIQQNHVFWVEDSNPTTMYIKASDDAEIVEVDFMKGDYEDRMDELLDFVIAPIEAPGLREIKQVELYTKFRKFVPEEFRDEICPKPSDHVLEKIKKDRSEKTKARNHKKKRLASREI